MAKVRTVAVADTSPLIALDRIGLGELLPELFEQVLITPAVLRELISGRPVDDAHEIVNEPNVLLTRAPPAPGPWPASLSTADREVIALAAARPQPCVALIDERAGRREAQRRGVTPMGTIAVLGLAKDHGVIDQIAMYLEALQESGFRVAPELVRAALRRAGESRDGGA